MNRNVTRQLARVLAALLLCTLVGTAPAKASTVDGYSGYQPQLTCATTAKPGTEYLLRWLVGQYARTGASGTLRSCESGGQSEHKDGRALDWAVDAADPDQAAQAERFLDRAFATDSAGNPHALARRMGIMYAIWNDHIYSSYHQFAKRDYTTNICAEPQDCSKTTRHRDHMHISLSYAGGAAQSSFYRTHNVASIPVLEPGTLQLDPVDTAIVKVTVPATGRVVTTGFKLTGGTTYRIVGDGLYRYGPGAKIADSACRWSVNGWVSSDNGLLVNGIAPWAQVCDGAHTHVSTYTPAETDYLRVRVGVGNTSNDPGALTFYVLREDLAEGSVASHPAVSGPEPRAARTAGPSGKLLRSGTVTVRAASPRGTLTERALRRNARYQVVVTGTAQSGADPFDGSCVKFAGRLQPAHTLDLTKPTADHLSLFIQGVRVNLRVPGSRAACNQSEHRYVGTFSAVVGGKARVKVWDPYTYGDNSGSLTVRLTKKA